MFQSQCKLGVCVCLSVCVCMCVQKIEMLYIQGQVKFSNAGFVCIRKKAMAHIWATGTLLEEYRCQSPQNNHCTHVNQMLPCKITQGVSQMNHWHVTSV